MNLFFDVRLAKGYTSQSQKMRILTESWVNQQVYCPNCGRSRISRYGNNKPVADFFCEDCKEDFELKSKKDSLGTKMVDGAYGTMIERLQSANNPNFFFLNYTLKSFSVFNFLVIPKHFFVPEIIEKRKPLSDTARRAGWIGCNVLLSGIPQSGKIFFVKNGSIQERERVIASWQKTLFLRDEREISSKGWLLDVMNCVEQFSKREFSLEEIYAFEPLLNKKHPNNSHIKDKIRQQLQVLRDRGYVEFLNRGVYRLKQ